MDHDPRLLAAANIVLKELGERPLQNEHPQTIVARARSLDQARLDELLYKFGIHNISFALACLKCAPMALQILLLNLISEQRIMWTMKR